MAGKVGGGGLYFIQCRGVMVKTLFYLEVLHDGGTATLSTQPNLMRLSSETMFSSFHLSYPILLKNNL